MNRDRELLVELGYSADEIKSWSDEDCEVELSYVLDGQDCI